MSILTQQASGVNKIPKKNNAGDVRVHPRSADDVLNRQHYNFSLRTIKAMMRPKEYKAFVERYMTAKTTSNFCPSPHNMEVYEAFINGKISLAEFAKTFGKKPLSTWGATSKLGRMIRYVTEQKHGRK